MDGTYCVRATRTAVCATADREKKENPDSWHECATMDPKEDGFAAHPVGKQNKTLTAVASLT